MLRVVSTADTCRAKYKHVFTAGYLLTAYICFILPGMPMGMTIRGTQTFPRLVPLNPSRKGFTLSPPHYHVSLVHGLRRVVSVEVQAHHKLLGYLLYHLCVMCAECDAGTVNNTKAKIGDTA